MDFSEEYRNHRVTDISNLIVVTLKNYLDTFDLFQFSVKTFNCIANSIRFSSLPGLIDFKFTDLIFPILGQTNILIFAGVVLYLIMN